MRGKRAPVRRIAPDEKYNNVLVAQFINNVMKHGKKVTAQKIVYGAFTEIEDIAAKDKKLPKSPVEVFEKAIKQVSPSVEVRSRRVGGSNLQVPIEVRPARATALAFRWILTAARGAKGKPMHKKLAAELVNAYKGEGAAIKKRDDVHRMAESNKAFARFA
jgi:small subunit ribosomal protein S7